MHGQLGPVATPLTNSLLSDGIISSIGGAGRGGVATPGWKSIFTAVDSWAELEILLFPGPERPRLSGRFDHGLHAPKISALPCVCQIKTVVAAEIIDNLEAGGRALIR